LPTNIVIFSAFSFSRSAIVLTPIATGFVTILLLSQLSFYSNNSNNSANHFHCQLYLLKLLLSFSTIQCNVIHSTVYCCSALSTSILFSLLSAIFVVLFHPSICWSDDTLAVACCWLKGVCIDATLWHNGIRGVDKKIMWATEPIARGVARIRWERARGYII
jgi:hypothetical protein